MCVYRIGGCVVGSRCLLVLGKAVQVLQQIEGGTCPCSRRKEWGGTSRSCMARPCMPLLAGVGQPGRCCRAGESKGIQGLWVRSVGHLEGEGLWSGVRGTLLPPRNHITLPPACLQGWEGDHNSHHHLPSLLPGASLSGAQSVTFHRRCC